MIFLVAAVFTVAGLFFTYVTVGLTRTEERRRGFAECERRIAALRRHGRISR